MIEKKLNSNFLIIKTGSIDTNNAETMLKKLSSNKTNFPIISIISLKPIISIEQIESAIHHSLKAFENNSNTAKSIQLEMLLFLSAQKQLNKALELMQLNGKDEVALIGFGKNKKQVLNEIKSLEKSINFTQKNGLIEKNLKKNFNQLKKLFNISDTEIKILSEKNKFDGLQKIVLEKIALTKIGE